MKCYNRSKITEYTAESDTEQKEKKNIRVKIHTQRNATESNKTDYLNFYEMRRMAKGI